MNDLFGNALKYTAQGFVWVSLRQTALPARNRGAGRRLSSPWPTLERSISEEYLQSHLFTAFSQEGRLAPAHGLA